MKNFKGFALGLVLGLSLAVSGLAFAQNTTPTDQKKDGESCCAMMKGGAESCDMKMKHDAKDATAHHGCCCCCGGDSCDMKMKHDMQEKPKG